MTLPKGVTLSEIKRALDDVARDGRMITNVYDFAAGIAFQKEAHTIAVEMERSGEEERLRSLISSIT